MGLILPASLSPLADIEKQMRLLLPADLYAAVWIEPESENLMRVFQHLRTLQHMLRDYVPRQVAEHPTQPGEVRFTPRQGTLLFTDLAGFTPLLEANAAYGQRGAIALLKVLNHYFSEMIEIISKSGGDLLEFTGDAMLVQFLADQSGSDAAQAVRAGLRMQRAMEHFQEIETPQGRFSLGMRVGIHTGQFVTADLGTPKRMVHVLVGNTVRQAKRAESAGQVGRVCLTREVGDRLQDQFHLDFLNEEYALVRDDLSHERLGEYEISLNRRRMPNPLLMDRSVPALLREIQQAAKRVEPLASYIPSPILNLLVENTAQRQITPNFPAPTVVFINLLGLPEAIDESCPDNTTELVVHYSRIFALIHAAAESHGGILQKVTYHSLGSDMLVYFGALASHPDDPIRASHTVLAVRKIIRQMVPPEVNGQPIEISCRIGMASGSVFAAEIGESRGRREFNILGDPVNTAARLMTQAKPNQILLTEHLYEAIAPQFYCNPLGESYLKGKAIPMAIYELNGRRD